VAAGLVMDLGRGFLYLTSMSEPRVDLRSDTVTKPSEEMRRAMAEAEVGDDWYGGDPTVNRLQERAAEIVGMEGAVFVPTGTMANQIGLRLHWSGNGHLVAVIVNLQLARELADADLPAAKAVLDDLSADAREALDSVRELAQRALREADVLAPLPSDSP